MERPDKSRLIHISGERVLTAVAYQRYRSDTRNYELFEVGNMEGLS